MSGTAYVILELTESKSTSDKVRGIVKDADSSDEALEIFYKDYDERNTVGSIKNSSICALKARFID